MIRKEWQRLLKNPVLIVVVAAIILIPSIYAGLFLASMWDPYGELDKLPVAVINLDKGAEYDGKEITIGDDLVDNLKKDGSLDFNFVEADEAEKGLRDGKYYMVVTIPEDFSYRATTVVDSDPEKMELMYETNPATNYIAMKLSETAMTKIEMGLQNKVSETYAEVMFEKFGMIGDGMTAAADGADLLIEGEDALHDGASKIDDGALALNEGASRLADGTDRLYEGTVGLDDGLDRYIAGVGDVNDGIKSLDEAVGTLSDGSGKIRDGASALADGTSELSEGAGALVNGSKDLSDGARDLADGTQRLSSGAADLKDGADRLSAGLDAIVEKIPALQNGISSLNSGAGDLCDGIKTYTDGVASAADGAAALSSGLGELSGGVSALAGSSAEIKGNIALIDQYAQAMAASGDPNWVKMAAYTSALSKGYGDFDAGMTSLDSSASQLAAGASGLSSGLEKLRAGSSALNEGAASLREGTKTLLESVPALSDGLSAAADGASALAKGADDLKNGIAAVSGGATKVADGAGRLLTGAQSLKDGIDRVGQGASTLSDKMNDLYNGTLRIKSGADALAEGGNTLAGKSGDLKNGADALVSGAQTLNGGAKELRDGSSDLKDGTDTLAGSFDQLKSGTADLRDGLRDGAGRIDAASLEEDNAGMVASPVTAEETKITNVKDNGHAMAAYMMSVGLWVASLAFCLMYPLMQHGKLTNGLSWWASKASVLYPMAILQAVILVLLLHLRLGFDPARFAGTIAVACLASAAFMSIMYLFNVLLGKVGSFIMLIFMVLQLAGSAGTYPIEISGPLAQALNRFMPFTYTVTAFRSTIGGGESCTGCIMVLLGILVVSTVLTIALFVVRGKEEKSGKKNLYDVMAEHGFA